jgi:hypothetical protein
MCDEFEHYHPKNFKSNLKSLLKAKEATGQDGGKVYLTNWRSSKAKELLKRLIEEERVTEASDPELVYKMSDEFENYKKGNFLTNLQSDSVDVVGKRIGGKSA